MSQPSRPQAHRPAQRRRHQIKFEAVQPLEDRCLLAPILAISPIVATSTPVTVTPAVPNTSLNNVTVTIGQADPGFLTAAPFDSVSQLTSISSFGGDIVRIRSGPGGPFGNDVYAISRGAGENSASLTAAQTTANNTTPSVVSGAINRPGVIYRVDPATGNTNTFFDLNTLIPQLSTNKSTTAANSVGSTTGLVNWYDITFDPEGYFDGKPSMFVSSVDRQDPAKNAIYRISPDGKFMGMFVQFSSGFAANNLTVNPSAILVPPPEDQTFLRGLIAGGGVSSTNTGSAFSALFFNANAYSPGQVIGTNTLPKGTQQTGLFRGPITGLTAANPDYTSRVYGTFTDFGTPAANGIPAQPGNSGVEGINGDLLIGNTFVSAITGTATAAPTGIISLTPTLTTLANTVADTTVGDRYPVLPTDFRRFEDIAFDQYGYFAQGANLGAGGTALGVTNIGIGSVGGTGAGGGSGTGVGGGLALSTLVRPAITLPPASAGNLFVADLATGLSTSIAVPAPPAATPPVTTPATSIRVPIQGNETVQILNTAAQNGTPQVTITPVGPGLGGRVVRITPNGVVRTFAYNFHTSNAIDSSSFAMSSLSLTFSADGTTMYVADDDGVWQFKTVASLAGSTSGSVTGLNDLRTLGVPYDGQGSAVAVIDTGVDAFSSPFRGRVAPGTNVYLNNNGGNDNSGGPGNDDTAVFGNFANNANGGGTGTGGGGALIQPAPLPSFDGHGTPVAGVVAQFVPQATIVPVNIFAPFLAPASTVGASVSGNGGGTGITLVTANSNALSTPDKLYQGLNYVTKHPFVNDPVRPGGVSRVIATTMGFGSTDTLDSESAAYRLYPQIFISLKSEFQKFRALGIAPIAAAGQFGKPFAAGIGTGNANNQGNVNTALTTGNNNSENSAVGDINGISLPAIFNEVVSVTGSYSFPFATGPGATPANPTQFGQPVGISGHQQGPVLIFGNSTVLGGGAVGLGSTGTSNGSLFSALTSLPGLLANADSTQYVDRILGSTNRNVTTDYAAPAIDVPTFRRTFAATTTGTGTGLGTTLGVQDPNDHNTFNDAGTSLSAAEVTGAFALVSSALGYWSNLAKTGYTADAYLTQPVGVNSLNFGKHRLVDLTAWNNPDGINAILQWTAVPASTANDATTASTPRQLFGSTQYPSFSRISVSNAIAAIEGYEALNYLINVGALSKLDASGNGIITATEMQDFENTAAAKGMPTVGAMARLLGGTARITSLDATPTLFGETPDQPDVLQRRFNFFDYSASGALHGSVTLPEYKMLSHTLLPAPDAFVINNRQKSSVDHYLVAPTTLRNYNALLHIQPNYQFVNATNLLKKYKNVSPAQFHINRGVTPSTGNFPVFTLFDTPISGQPSTTGTTGAGNTSPGNAATTGASATTGNSSDGNTSTGNAVTTNPANTGAPASNVTTTDTQSVGSQTSNASSAPSNVNGTNNSGTSTPPLASPNVTGTSVATTSPNLGVSTSPGGSSPYTAFLRQQTLLGNVQTAGTVTPVATRTAPATKVPTPTAVKAEPTGVKGFLHKYLGIG